MSRITFRQISARIAREALQDLPAGTTYQAAQYALDQVSPLQSSNTAEARIWSEERKKAIKAWRLTRQEETPPGLFSGE